MTRKAATIVAIVVALTGGGLAWYYTGSEAVAGIDVSNARQVTRGEMLYAQECASCHGKELKGQTRNWRQRLPDGSIPAPPHDATGHTWHHPDHMLFEITKLGRLKAAQTATTSNMPAFEKKLSDEDIWAVLSFIKSQWPAGIQQRHDEMNKRYKAAR